MSVWKPIQETSGYYEISDEGQIRNALSLKFMKITKMNSFTATVQGKRAQLGIGKLMLKYFPTSDDLWRDIPGFDLYECTSAGQVRHKRNLNILNPELKKGYLRVVLYRDDGSAKKMLVHRIIAMVFLPQPTEENMSINHKNGIKSDNRAENLEWATQSEQIIHAQNIGLRSKQSIISFEDRIDVDDIEWKPVANSKYEVSNYGTIRNVKSGIHRKLSIDSDNRFILVGTIGDSYTSWQVHRLVAIAFIPNLDNLPEVDHIDKNPSNNHVSNLRWVSRSDNSFHANARKIFQHDLDNNKIKEWDSIKDAVNGLGISRSAISSCLRGVNKTAGGFKWSYANP